MRQHYWVLAIIVVLLQPLEANTHNELSSVSFAQPFHPPKKQQNAPLPPPPPPQELPLRFLRAGKGDPSQGRRRYRETLAWRRKERIDSILREPFPDFWLIKQHYPHYYHFKGRQGQPVYYEQPAKTNLAVLRQQGVTLSQLLRHYTMITEFQWQLLAPDDSMTSIFVVDLVGLRLGDFVGETVEFVKLASKLSAAHYPERAGVVLVVNVPRFFSLIWKVLRPIVDRETLQKVFVLGTKDEIRTKLRQHIALENIPPEYGGTSMPLGQAPEEQFLYQLMQHNLELSRQGLSVCPNCRGHPSQWPCPFCKWTPPRSY